MLLCVAAFSVWASLAAASTVPTSHVKGAAFDRLAILYFENTNFAKAYDNDDFLWLSKQGITLTNYFGVTHPSQPNYIAGITGDYFGMDHDSRVDLDASVSTVIDLLESKSISWAHYQEDMPYTGFQGNSFHNPTDGSNDYVRKHNPAVHFSSVSNDNARLNRLMNLSRIDTDMSAFHRDLEANALPQWMFITPNMTSDGHDRGLEIAGSWARSFIEPLINDKNFMQNTLVLVTWDEAEIDSSQRNQILGILLGDTVDKELVGTNDDSFYTHYSEIASVSANWDLPTLGRWDVGANVFKIVANKTGDTIRTWDSQSEFEGYYWSTPYGGNQSKYGSNDFPMPKPNLDLDPSHAGRHILQSIRDTWTGSDAPTYYTDTIKVADGYNPPSGFKPEGHAD